MNKRFYLTVILLSCAITQISAQVIHRLDVDRFTHYRIDDWISYAPALNITTIDIGPDFVYFGTRGGGVLRYDKYANEWYFPHTTSNGLRSNKIRKLVYNPEDNFLYALTPKGIDVHRPAEDFWQPANIDQLPYADRSNPGNPYDHSGNDKYRFPPYFRPPNSLLPDFFTQFPLMFQPPNKIYDQYNRQFRFTDRITDTWQRIWIGTDGIGPMVADLYTFRMESKLYSLSNISPRDIHIQDDYIWIGGMPTSFQVGGITRWDRERDEWTYFEAPLISHLSRDDVHAISGNKDYTVFATILGVAIYNSKKDDWRTITAMQGLEGDDVYDVVTTDSIIYIATEYGFNWIDIHSMKVYELNETTLDNVAIYQLAIGKDLIWAATRYGLYSIDPENHKVRFHSSKAGVIDYNLRAIEIIGDEIWFASTNGISFWNRTSDTWTSFPALELNAHYRDIASTKNCVWFATDRGLLKYDREREYWRLFTKKDGLLSNNVFHLDPEHEYLWCTTDHGITAFLWNRDSRLD